MPHGLAGKPYNAAELRQLIQRNLWSFASAPASEDRATKKSGRAEAVLVYKGADLGGQNGNPSPQDLGRQLAPVARVSTEVGVSRQPGSRCVPVTLEQ